MKSCLLVIDMQKEFKSGCLSADMVNNVFIDRVRNLIEFCRKKKIEVIFTRHIIKKDLSDKEKYEQDPCYCIEGTEGIEFMEGIEPLEKEKIFRKNRISGLYKTGLEECLREKNYDEVVICGVLTNCCVRQTALELQIRDFKVYLIKDCCAAMNKNIHELNLRDIEEIVSGVKVLNLKEFKEMD